MLHDCLMIYLYICSSWLLFSWTGKLVLPWLRGMGKNYQETCQRFRMFVLLIQKTNTSNIEYLCMYIIRIYKTTIHFNYE